MICIFEDMVGYKIVKFIGNGVCNFWNCSVSILFLIGDDKNPIVVLDWRKWELWNGGESCKVMKNGGSSHLCGSMLVSFTFLLICSM